MKKYGYYTANITSMIRQKIEEHQNVLLNRTDANKLLQGDVQTALMFAEMKGAVQMANEIIEELETEDDE